MSSSAVVRDHPAAQRYELVIDEGLAIATYTIDGGVITFDHTEVPEAARGQGVASRLIAGALADVRTRGLSVTPRCPAVTAYMRRHADVQDLLSDEGRALVARAE